MKQCAFIFLILTFFVCTSSFAQSKKVSFKDPYGNIWNRWVIVEPQEGRTILSVYEDLNASNDQRATTQVVVARHVFSNLPSDKEITEKTKYYLKLKDLRLRGADYYKKNEIEIQTPRPLWVPVKNSWDLVDEKKFSDWYRANASTQMAKDAGIIFDCADFGLLGRWIFAHDNKLPIGNTLSGSGKLFGHFSESKNWSHLPTNSDWKKDERFKAALKYLFDSTYTRSIISDLYPTVIRKDFVAPGSIILTLRSDGTGHTQVILDVGVQTYCGTECITTLYGNQPSRDIAYFSLAHLGNHTEKTGGFLRWRWPVFKNNKWQLIAKTNMPGYSLEQYQHPEYGYDEFYSYVIEKLEFKAAPFFRARSLARSLYDDIRDRLEITALGSAHCHFQYCDPQGTLYDEYSTPSKDKRFREKRDQFLRLVAALTEPEKNELRSNYNYAIFEVQNYLSTFSNYIFNDNGISDQMSSDPSQAFSVRWGLKNLSQLENSIVDGWEFYKIMRTRLNLVYNAIYLCENGCDIGSAPIKALFTDTLDDSIRKLQIRFYGNYSAINDLEKAILQQNYLNNYLAEGCKENPDGECVAKDYILPEKGYLNKMTSNPTHSYSKRMGFE